MPGAEKPTANGRKRGNAAVGAKVSQQATKVSKKAEKLSTKVTAKATKVSDRMVEASDRIAEVAERTAAAADRVAAAVDPSEDGADPQPPWWRERRRRPGGREPLNREAIVDAAVRILDAAGADALTLRRLGRELDTGAATLYWHLSGKDELGDLVYDRIMGAIVLPEPDAERWEEQIKDVTRQGYRIMLSHNDAVKLSIGRVPLGPNMLRLIEWQLALFRAAGIPDQAAAYFGDLIGRFVDGSVLDVSSSPSASGKPAGSKDTDARADGPRGAVDPSIGAAMIRDYFAGLSPQRFPMITSMADHLMAGGDDDRFEFGLDVLIRGLRSTIADAD